MIAHHCFEIQNGQYCSTLQGRPARVPVTKSTKYYLSEKRLWKNIAKEIIRVDSNPTYRTLVCFETRLSQHGFSINVNGVMFATHKPQKRGVVSQDRVQL